MNDAQRRERALEALSRARRRSLPLSVAAHEVRLTPDEVLEHTAEGWERHRNDWLATSHDRIRRDMSILTPDGPVAVVIRDSREATLASQHATAVRHYRDEGVLDWIEALPRDWVMTEQGRVPLAVSARDLDRLMEGAELAYDVYQRLG